MTAAAVERVLITGGMGFIGSHTARALLDLGHSCLLTRHRTNGEPQLVKDEIGGRVAIERVDLADRSALLALGDRHRISGIVHLADPALTHLADPPLAATTLIEDLRRGVVALLNVLESAVAWGVPRVTVASTIGVYGGLPDTRALPEDAALPMASTSSPIPSAKKIAELLSTLVRERGELDVVIARLPAVWGPLGRRHSRFFAAPGLVHEAVGDAAAESSSEGEVPYAEDAIDTLYVKDCARAIALLQTAERLRHPVYNVGSGHTTSNREVAAIIERLIPAARPSLQAGRNPHAPAHDVYLDTARLLDDTGFQPEYDLEHALGDYIAWLKEGHEL